MQRWYDSSGQGDEIIGGHGSMIPETDPAKEFDGLGVLDDDGYQHAAGATIGRAVPHPISWTGYWP